MSAGIINPQADWTRHVTKKMSINKSDTPSASTRYTPPLRVLRALVAGTVVFCLAEDDDGDVTKKVSVTMAAGDTLTYYAIRHIYSTGTTFENSELEGFI